jgi:hypothetical protein
MDAMLIGAPFGLGVLIALGVLLAVNEPSQPMKRQLRRNHLRVALMNSSAGKF